jgi:hypothetical protein
MGFPLKNKLSSQLIFSIIIGLSAFIILYLSIIRASLDVMVKENNENKLRVEPIEFLINKKNGPEKCVYKLPEVNVMPDDPIYKIKESRDFMWILLSHDPLLKAKTTLLIADKKITESLNFEKDNKCKLALDTSEEAINKLKYADKIVFDIKKESTESRQLKNQIIKAGLAYKEALIKINLGNKIDQDKYNKIIIDLDKWNEEKQKNIEEI